jgi:hypothetical protein
MQDFISVINNVGFPIFVALYMLIQGTKENKQTRETIEKLTIAVEKLCTKIEGDKSGNN